MSIEKTCECCGKVFRARNDKTRFCSWDCYTHKMERQFDTVCSHCGAPLRIPCKEKRYKKHFCGNECKKAWDAKNRKREAAPNWKGGIHPYVQEGKKLQHRKVAEQKIGRPLTPGEVVHHINGNKKDNRPENLEVMLRSEHMSMHLTERWAKRKQTEAE